TVEMFAPGQNKIPEATFYTALIFLAECDSEGEAEREQYFEKIAPLREKMKIWSDNCPANFLHRHYLIEAEIARVKGDEMKAMDLYLQAIDSAKENEYINLEALGNELYGKFWLRKKQSRIAEIYLKDAHYLYRRWGAFGKVKAMEEVYPQLLTQDMPKVGTRQTINMTTTTTGGTDVLDLGSVMKTSQTITSNRTIQHSISSETTGNIESLDINSIIKASQTISGEIVIDNLLGKLMNIVVENAGAEMGVLLLNSKSGLVVEIEQSKNSVNLMDSIPIQSYTSDNKPLLPKTIINYVKRTNSYLVLSNATNDVKFGKDPYVIQHQPRSVFCMPLLNQSNLIGILYLENNLNTDVFANDRVETLKLLSSQAAISIQNANFYSTMKDLNKAYARFVPTQFLDFLGKEDITQIQLGDQIQKEMTILFSDIRSFTSLSENMSPQENFNFLNSYLRRVGPVIRENGGFIDKYIGDAIMALFPGDPGDALRAAVAMQKEIDAYNESRTEQNFQEITVGIGIHTGNLILGTIGENQRMEGTVISDAVNLASRLEGLTKFYGSNILISDSVLTKLQNQEQHRYRILDKVKVKGKNKPVTVIEILDALPETTIEIFLNSKKDFETAIDAYLTKNFDRSNYYFRKVIGMNPHDKAAPMYLKRSEYYSEHGAPLDWEGIAEM
ncbi:MAG: adenylate/guanylate cyclase domain-containing protein, partial [Spirochaetota bacterium]